MEPQKPKKEQSMSNILSCIVQESVTELVHEYQPRGNRFMEEVENNRVIAKGSRFPSDRSKGVSDKLT